jgi:MFS transporter, SP family, solute carrier family 2 (facilitated glucose transporter), member 3
VKQYGYHTSALNQLQAVLTCKVTDDTTSTYYGLPTCIPMSDATFSVVTAMFTVGGFFGSLFSNIVMDRYGRKGASRLSAALTATGAALFGLSASVGPLILGRYVLHTSNIHSFDRPRAQISCWSCSRPWYLPLSYLPI